jgi:hypothetical protein
MRMATRFPMCHGGWNMPLNPEMRSPSVDLLMDRPESMRAELRVLLVTSVSAAGSASPPAQSSILLESMPPSGPLRCREVLSKPAHADGCGMDTRRAADGVVGACVWACSWESEKSTRNVVMPPPPSNSTSPAREAASLAFGGTVRRPPISNC